MLNYWMNVAMLAAESQRTIWLRMIKMSAGGPNARSEARLMVAEKINAATEATGNLARGATPIASSKLTVRKSEQILVACRNEPIR